MQGVHAGSPTTPGPEGVGLKKALEGYAAYSRSNLASIPPMKPLLLDSP